MARSTVSGRPDIRQFPFTVEREDMKAAVGLNFQNLYPGVSDSQAYAWELGIGEKAEDLGFDAVWSVEHHFDSYAMAPSNIAILAYLAGRTSTIKLGTGAVILPWHTPLRVASNIAALDNIAPGRVLFGMGRGLAKMEYEKFGIDMNEARGRFTESARMVLDALETGVISGDGPFYPQPRAEIRPRAVASFRDRIFGVAMSPESAPIVGELGAAFMTFVQKPMEEHLPGIDAHRQSFKAAHGRDAPPPTMAQMLFCHEDAAVAEETARRYIANYFLSVVKHYDFTGEHFGATQGYQSYDEMAAAIRDAGLEAAAQGYVDTQLWGTPDQILEKLRGYQQVIGDFDTELVPTHGGIPIELAERSLALFSREVLPELKKF